jgi:hypothetical protein
MRRTLTDKSPDTGTVTLINPIDLIRTIHSLRLVVQVIQSMKQKIMKLEQSLKEKEAALK